jgi:hypothetical protein
VSGTRYLIHELVYCRETPRESGKKNAQLRVGVAQRIIPSVIIILRRARLFKGRCIALCVSVLMNVNELECCRKTPRESGKKNTSCRAHAGVTSCVQAAVREHTIIFRVKVDSFYPAAPPC